MDQQKSIKDIIKQEYAKCAQDPVYFIKKYVWIQHPTRGRIQFNLFPFQEKVLRLLFNNDKYDIILKSRQLGISTLVGPGLSLWTMLFNKDKNILVIATKQDTAKNLVTKVIFAYDNLPSWLRLDYKEKNKLSLKLVNGSQIKATSAASDAGRSEASSLLIIDEAAFIDNIEDIFGSAQQTLATGGKCIALSTPNGTGNWFHREFKRAETDPNSEFRAIRLPWTVHPERDQKWRDKQDSLLGPKMAAQECDCDFITSGDTVFEADILKFYEETHIVPPVERRGFDSNLWIWESPNYTTQYMIVADVARGDGKDYSAFHIIDIDRAMQIGEWKGQLGTTDYGNLLVGIATEYNDAILVIENTGVGWSVVQQAINRGYKKLYYSSRNDTTNLVDINSYMNRYEENPNLVPGFTTSLKTRPLLISKLDSYLKERSCVFQSQRLLSEMRTFIWKNGRADAQEGYNDDLLMAFAIGLFIRDTVLRFKQQGIDLTKAVLGGFTKSSGIGQGLYNPTNTRQNNPWKMDLGNGEQEDFTWLL